MALSLRYLGLDIIGMISSQQNGVVVLKYAEYLSMLASHLGLCVLRFCLTLSILDLEGTKS